MSSTPLFDLIQLEKLDDNLFRGQNYKPPWGRVFGGQVLSQAMNAARRTVPEDRVMHSMHGYFILSGDIEQPIIYQVDPIRDGKSFNTRRVVAYQKGRAIFNMSASFQIEEEGFSHQIPMPNVVPPENLKSDEQWAEEHKDELPSYYQKFVSGRNVEFRPVERFDPLHTEKAPPVRNIWLRVEEELPGKMCIHHEALAYASDYNLMSTSLLPHRGDFQFEKIQMASLDHAMWFHRSFRADEWLLFSLDSPSSSNSRGFNRGNFFNREGQLVASVAQEGLIRNRG